MTKTSSHFRPLSPSQANARPWKPYPAYKPSGACLRRDASQRGRQVEWLVKKGPPEGIKSPTDVGTGKAKEDKVPLSEIIQVLNDRFGTNFTEEDRLFFEQIREKALNDEKVIRTARANPLDKFQLGIRKLIEELMIQRMADNDKIVTRYMDDQEFQNSAFPILAQEIFESIQASDMEPAPERR